MLVEAEEDNMPMNAALSAADVFSPEEVAMLNHIYSELSMAPGFPPDKAAREALAQRILFQYQAGVVEPRALKEACASIR
jgi:hypothetical protein